MNTHITKIVGEKNILDSPADLEAYSIDASMLERKPQMIIFPKTTEQIRKILNYCNRMNISIVPRGAGTNTVGEAIGSNAYILDFSKMNEVLGLNKEEKYIKLQPGVVIKNLNNFLSQYNLEFPVQPPEKNSCTIGGLLALNKFGFRAFKYGRIIDWVLELEVLDGTGKFYKFNTKKDFEKFIGTEGCVGIIVGVKIKLIEPIKETSVSVYDFEEIVDLITKLRGLVKTKDILALELVDKLNSVYLGWPEEYHLIVEHIGDKGKTQEPLKIRKIKNKRLGLYKLLLEKGYIYREDPNVPIDQMYDLLEWFKNNQISVFGSLKENTIHAFFNRDQKNLREELYEMVRKNKGDVSSVYGYGLLKKDYVPMVFKKKLIRLKEKYDYNNILNRGKIIDYK